MSINRDYAALGARRFQQTVALCCLLALGLVLPGFVAQAANPIPGPAILLTPADGATFDRLNPPQLSWSQGQPLADYFYISILRNGSTYLNFWLAPSTLMTNFWTTNMPAGSYTWWVRTWSTGGWGQWSAGWKFTVEGVPHVITAISPQGTTESSSTLTYAWNAPDAYTAWYELLIWKNGAKYSDTWHAVGPGDLQTSTNGQITQLALTLKNQPSGMYNWWVRGWSPDGMGPWSTTMTFTNRLTPPGTLTLMTPANGAVVSNSLPQCSWQNNGGATCYWLWLYRNGAVYCSQWLDGATTWTPTNNLPAGNYTWWIVPWSPDGYGTWASGNFSVPLRVPGSMMLMGPVGNMCENSPMKYSWTADANTAWYQLLILKGSATLVNRWYAANASSSWETNTFEITIPEQHTSGNYTWWVRGWSPDGMGPWCSTNFMIYGANEVMPLAGSSWTGNFTEITNGVAKTHFIEKLTFNVDGTFTGSGTYQLWSLPNNITQTPETYSGTYSINGDILTAEGNEFLDNSPQGNLSFTFSFDNTFQHITSGAWMDTWDNQQFTITPDSGAPYVTIIYRLCGQ